MSNFKENHANLTSAKRAIDSVIKLSRKQRLTTCRVQVTVGGESVADFEAPIGIVSEVVNTGLRASVFVEQLFNSLGLDKEYGTA